MATLKIDERERYPRCLWISVAGSLAGAFNFGWNVAVLNTALPYIAKDLHYHKDAVLSSAVVLGAASGALLAGKAADHWGPRHAQVFNCLPFMLGALLAASSQHHNVFLMGRFVSGIGRRHPNSSSNKESSSSSCSNRAQDNSSSSSSSSSSGLLWDSNKCCLPGMSGKQGRQQQKQQQVPAAWRWSVRWAASLSQSTSAAA
uniref:Major facilitator superfamily (MFS) profile domain-containing protein n=1 Tax=Tetradesmus obliquus TaxID=3088 RepID=A0A383WDI7_TETOB|eukprot:jgi/Sobl393_1/7059/SZX75675.1